jgi:hypothetical protein
VTGKSPTPQLVRALRYRRHLGRTTLTRGKTPKAPDIGYGNGCLVLILGIAAVAVLWAALYAITVAISIAIDVGIAIAVLLALRSFRDWIMPVVRGEVFNSKALWASPPVATFAMGALPAGALAYATTPQPLTIAASAIVGGIVFRPLAYALDGKRFEPAAFLPARRQQVQPEVEFDFDEPGDFGLWIGEASGALAQMGHRAGITPGANVTLNLADAAKNIAIFGETGTGKTTRVINHLLVQALDFDAGALIFDVRGDFHETATLAGQLTGKTVQRIGVGQLGLNLLAGLTPNTAAGVLEAAFKLLGQGEGDSAFWLSLAVVRCQNALGVLNHVPDHYSLRGLYRFVFDDHSRKNALAAANDALLELQVQAADGDPQATLDMRRLKGALDYETTVAPAYTDKERSGINRTIETALARFTDPELEDAFCTAQHEQARIEELLDGNVFVVNVPREQFKAAARVAYLFLKERFFQALNERAQMAPGPRKDRPVLFLCDEYQQICSAGDATFFDTSRALNVVAIVAAQSVEAYINATGNEHTAHALLANFTNVIAFRSTERTMNFVAGKLGDVDVWKQSWSAGKTDLGLFKGVTTNQGRSLAEERRKLLGPQLFRTLAPDHAVALLSVGGVAFDDVIRVPQLTTDDLT